MSSALVAISSPSLRAVLRVKTTREGSCYKPAESFSEGQSGTGLRHPRSFRSRAGPGFRRVAVDDVAAEVDALAAVCAAGRLSAPRRATVIGNRPVLKTGEAQRCAVGVRVPRPPHFAF